MIVLPSFSSPSELESESLDLEDFQATRSQRTSSPEHKEEIRFMYKEKGKKYEKERKRWKIARNP